MMLLAVLLISCLSACLVSATKSPNIYNEYGEPSPYLQISDGYKSEAEAQENVVEVHTSFGQSFRSQQASPDSTQGVEVTTILSQHHMCKKDFERICQSNGKAGDLKEEGNIQQNFEILDCLMSYKGEQQPPSADCLSVIHQYKKTLTTDDKFETATKEVCKELIQSHKIEERCGKLDIKGGYLPCLMEFASYVQIEKSLGQNCYVFLNKIQRVIFSDYHLTHDFGFLKDCEDDILDDSTCRNIFDQGPTEKDMLKHHEQGRVIECLIKYHFSELSKKCKHQILRVSELQADDYHLDRPLYFACRADRKRHCGKVQAVEGKVYKCLMEKQQEGVLDSKCVDQLIRREGLMEEDVKIDRTFYQACKNILQETGCTPTADSDSKNAIHSMRKTLTCLLDAEAEKDLNVTKQCQNEIELFQATLMNAFQITVGIVTNCKTEIDEHCKGMKKAHQKDGTIHCLMALAMPTRQKEKHQANPLISNQCKAEVTSLLDEAKPASVLAIDGFLMEQCNQELHKYCQNNNQPLDCLMDQIRTGRIDQESQCARHLLELEYFISRNYKLDMRFVKACHKNIETYSLDHHLKADQGPPSGDLVFAQLCKLVRFQLQGIEMKKGNIDKKCIVEVLRCVHERAVSIDLNPELEEACLPQLTSICKDAEHGEEIGCLEENVEDIKESTDPEKPGCREMMEEYIKSQDADYQLDTILLKACEPSVKKHCDSVLAGVQEGEIDEGEIFECLLEHKFDKEMDPMCFAGIEHHQIINMQDFKFNHKFREACNKDFKVHCKRVKSKSEAVYCLSAVIRNDTLLDTKHRVSRKCRAQLKVEFLALEDTIQMDPLFKEKCSADIKNHCSTVKPQPDGNSTDLYLGCTKSVDPDELKPQCAKYIFKVTKLNNAVAGASAVVFRQCKSEIKTICKDYMDDSDKLLDCLDENYDQLSDKCQNALDEEEEQDNQDIRLNPALYMPCKSDINKFCEKEMNKVHEDDESFHGAVINCLKIEYLKGERSGLSDTCSNQMHLLVVKVQTRDYKMDYVLTHQCKKEIAQCTKAHNEKDVIKCLKLKLFDGELKYDPQCQAEVFRLVTENRVDIHTDRELYNECKGDLVHSPCKLVLAESGRLMSCLLTLYKKGTITNEGCKEMVKSRMELWEHAVKLSVTEVLQQVWAENRVPESHQYFFAVLAVVVLAVILFIGIRYRRTFLYRVKLPSGYEPIKSTDM